MAIELSVAIIFKNEIRCIERCLKSLQPLKDKISCEIVMADTGSSDGSREIAEKYADTLFDFPWIDDFSAARNAVLKRCFGRWVLVIDCDEWLDPDVSELTGFLKGKLSTQRFDNLMLTVRDYTDATLEGYMDFAASRLLRVESGPYYIGKIHEHIQFKRPLNRSSDLPNVILHHDGYVVLNNGSEEGNAKRERNRNLLRQELSDKPNSLNLLMQYLESSDASYDDFYPTMRKTVALVEAKERMWREIGPVILRMGVFEAFNHKWPELHEWANTAHELFPNSYFTKIDVSFILLADAMINKRYEDVIRYGETFLQAYKAFPDDPQGRKEISVSSLQKNSAFWEQYVRIRVADSYRLTERADVAIALLEKMKWTLLDSRHVKYFIGILQTMPQNKEDVGRLLSECWNGIRQPIPSAEKAEARVEAFKELVDVGDAKPELQDQAVYEELRQLAARVKTILAKLPPEDPIALDLKNSPAYQKVSWLIEDEVL